MRISCVYRRISSYIAVYRVYIVVYRRISCVYRRISSYIVVYRVYRRISSYIVVHRVYIVVYRRISLHIVGRRRRNVAISFNMVCRSLSGLAVDRAYIAAWRLHVAIRRLCRPAYFTSIYSRRPA